MKIVGIIAEYNPFHEGHAYHIAQAKARAGADYCVVVMSGYFVQRGEPAVYDPFKRAKSALDAGADAVFAMPALFSCASAEIFAGYGVGLLNDLGCDAISFGVESWDAELFDKAADILAEEPERFKAVLKERLKAGESFAAARMEAAEVCIQDRPNVGHCDGDAIHSLVVHTNESGQCDESEVSTGRDGHGNRPLMNQPNQILALEYLRALKKLNSSMQVVPVERVGHGYHDEALGDTQACGITETENAVGNAVESAVAYPSATALRKKLREDAAEGCIFPQDIWPMMLSVIMRKLRDGEDLTQYEDVSPEIANRIVTLIGKPCCGDFGAFTSKLKTRQYAYTRIARSLMHIFLDHKKQDICEAREAAGYAILLGFRRDSSRLLRELKRRSSVPIISKAADAEQVIMGCYEGETAQTACRSFESDVYASRLYATAYMCKYGRLLTDLYNSRIEVLSDKV
jgi:predicted nucleotidyltransferase